MSRKYQLPEESKSSNSGFDWNCVRNFENEKWIRFLAVYTNHNRTQLNRGIIAVIWCVVIRNWLKMMKSSLCSENRNPLSVSRFIRLGVQPNAIITVQYTHMDVFPPNDTKNLLLNFFTIVYHFNECDGSNHRYSYSTLPSCYSKLITYYYYYCCLTVRREFTF